MMTLTRSDGSRIRLGIAGVEIVVNHRPTWADGRAWRIDPEPVLRIGSGGVAVADEGSGKVRFFGAAGALEGTVGGRGRGPGEFTTLADRAGVRDSALVVVFDSAGALIDTVGAFPGRELVIRVEDGRGVMTTRPFGADLAAVTRDTVIVVGTQHEPVLEEYAAYGELRRRIVLPDRDERSIVESDVEAYLERRRLMCPKRIGQMYGRTSGPFRFRRLLQ